LAEGKIISIFYANSLQSITTNFPKKAFFEGKETSNFCKQGVFTKYKIPKREIKTAENTKQLHA